MNTGEMILSICDEEANLALIKKMEQIGINIFSGLNKLHIPYANWEQLQRCTSLIQSVLNDEQLDKFKGYLKTNEQSDVFEMKKYPLSQLSLIIENPMFVKIIQEKLFQSFMQPIISALDQEVIGYEFLLRPNSKIYSFSPGDLFLFSQHAGLQSTLDSQARVNAIRTGSQFLPKGVKQFINFLPSSIYDPVHCLKSTFEAVEEYDVDPEDLVFEVVETEKIRDLVHLKNIFEHYQRAGIKVALDDIGSGYSTIELLKELKPDYAKIDRDLIRNCHVDSSKLEKVQQLRMVTKEMGIILLAEGIETMEEYNAVQPYVDLAQGYYFGKPMRNPA